MTQTDPRTAPANGRSGQQSSAPTFSIGARRIAQVNGSKLVRVGARLSLGQYIKELWQFRHFLFYDSRSRVSSQNNLDSMGRVWMLVNPALQALVYLTIFGIILETSRGVVNFIGYIIIGVFTFRFITGAVTGGADSIARNQRVVQSFNFPRAALPISATIRELFASVPVFFMMAVLVYFLGDYEIGGLEEGVQPIHLTWHWLLFFPAIFLALLVMTGLGLMLARMVNAHNDIKHLVQIGTRIWFYASAVIFGVDRFSNLGHDWIITVMHLNPAFCVLDIIRSAWLYAEFPDPYRWVVLSAWAVGAMVIGFIVFWLGEESYGKER
ncbi:ABC transporter permease [Nesterenkonia alba]|uniref:ABC transporter permease n=1 Tax=Nesterenkonia alba TaxID=515814 RepID=UPI0003B5347D|nr:ABC transporter permease [Nesterenkonia alba]